MNTKNIPKILFRVDGGRIRSVSLGHVFRCLALARELEKQYRGNITFLMRDYADGIKVVQDNGFPVQRMAMGISHDQELELIVQTASRLAIFDLLDIAEKDIGRLSDMGMLTVAIDDTGSKKIGADVVINGSIVEQFHHYPETSKDTKYYLGPEYCILGDEFTDLPRREVKPGVESIMVSMGGSDPIGLTAKVVKALGKIRIPATIKVILGPAFQDEEEVKQATHNSDNNFVISRNVPSMARVICQSDIAITAGGIMAYELAATGTPGIIIPSNEVEALTASAFRQQGTAFNLEDVESDFGKQLRERLSLLMSDTSLRAKMSQCGQQLVDGQGRIRLVKVLGNMLKM